MDEGTKDWTSGAGVPIITVLYGVEMGYGMHFLGFDVRVGVQRCNGVEMRLG